MLNLPSTMFTFMGNNLIEFEVVEFDELRIYGQDKTNCYTFYIKDCYKTKQEAIQAMEQTIEALK